MQIFSTKTKKKKKKAGEIFFFTWIQWICIISSPLNSHLPLFELLCLLHRERFSANLYLNIFCFSIFCVPLLPHTLLRVSKFFLPIPLFKALSWSVLVEFSPFLSTSLSTYVRMNSWNCKQRNFGVSPLNVQLFKGGETIFNCVRFFSWFRVLSPFLLSN